MTSISSLGSSNAWGSAIPSQRSQQSARLAEKPSANFDAGGSLNESELQSLMDDISSRTGQSGSSDSTGTAATSGVGSAGGAGGSTTTVHDELDTHEDGTVSLAERLAGAAADAADAAISSRIDLVEQLQQSAQSWAQNRPQRHAGHRAPCLPGRQRRNRRSAQHLPLYALRPGFSLRGR